MLTTADRERAAIEKFRRENPGLSDITHATAIFRFGFYAGANAAVDRQMERLRVPDLEPDPDLSKESEVEP